MFAFVERDIYQKRESKACMSTRWEVGSSKLGGVFLFVIFKVSSPKNLGNTSKLREDAGVLSSEHGDVTDRSRASQ